MEKGEQESDLASELLAQLNNSGDQPLTRVMDVIEERYPDDHQAIATILYLYRTDAVNISGTPAMVSLKEIGYAFALSLKKEKSPIQTWFPSPPKFTPLDRLREFVSTVTS